jgi:UDPglucose 6-dehydrogenase
VNSGHPPVEEPLLGEMIRDAGGRLKATTDPSEAVATQASFFIPPSPSLPDGSFSNEHLLKAMQPLAKAVKKAEKKGHLFVVSSTTTPGAMQSVFVPMLEKEMKWKAGTDFGVCYNPEFIALGNVVKGLLEPDLVLIGESDPNSGAWLEDLYRRYTLNKPRIARMSMSSAELTKISVNSFVTMKISFTNQLRMIAERLPGANIHQVLDAIGSDSRIGSKYLKAGLSYGGPCFPRDNRLVSFVAKQTGVSAPLAEASDTINEAVKEDLVEQATKLLGDQKQTVAVLGMAYKPDTYITEESAGLYLAQKLKRLGHHVLVHDYASTGFNSPALHEFESMNTPESITSREDVALVALCCAWPLYRKLKFSSKAKILDPWGLL